LDDDGFLDLLYEAVLRPQGWVRVLERFADIVGAGPANLTRLDVTTGLGPIVAARSDPAILGLYMEQFAHQNPLNNVPDARAYSRDWRPCILTDADWIPREDLVKTAFYNEFLEPIDRCSAMMVRLALFGDEVCVLNVYRSEAAGRFQRAEVERAATLHGHLIRAFDLSRRLASDRATDLGTGSVFDRSPHGLFLLDASGRILRANAAGDALLRDRCGLTARGGRLAAETPETARRLEGLVKRAADPDPRARRAGFLALHGSPRVLPLSLAVLPVRGPDLPIFCDAPGVLVCVTDLEAGARPPLAQLRELFGLTPAEARLAIALMGGETLREAASNLGVSANTAGVHLARIFDKTGVNRQAALMAVLLRAVGPALDDLETSPP
jgi:DNA-binding CsgD family transcriptional regulator